MKNRILFATDVPFWQASTGAEQRILAMCRFLKHRGKTCSVFFLGDLSEDDRQQINALQLDVIENSSDRPPEKLMNRIRWYADATINQARTWLYQSNKNPSFDDGPSSLRLDDFEWPWAAQRFSEVVDSFHPDVVIFEYIKMAYLLDGLSRAQRQRLVAMVDTHDVLYQRAEQFFANGFPHWLRINQNEESQVLKKFDTVIAIQNQEADTFRQMVDDEAEVITVGHAVDADIADRSGSPPETPARKITVGYIGSKNFSNWQAIRDFLKGAWPAVLQKNGDTCDLVIAGGICDWFDRDDSGEPIVAESDSPAISGCEEARFDRSNLENVKLLGRIDDVEEFYDSIDVVINPVQFGTGLKIKNAESLRFGKLLITTTNGFNGMPEATRLACMVVETINEMGLAINSICSDLSAIRPMQKLALQLSQTEFSESQAYHELIRVLDSPEPA